MKFESTDRLLQLHTEMTIAARALMKQKNADYGDHRNNDPFANFRDFGLLGIMVRMCDKFARLKTYVRAGTLQVKSESVTDTLLDLINYSVLMQAWIMESVNDVAQEVRDASVENSRDSIRISPLSPERGIGGVKQPGSSGHLHEDRLGGSDSGGNGPSLGTTGGGQTDSSGSDCEPDSSDIGTLKRQKSKGRGSVHQGSADDYGRSGGPAELPRGVTPDHVTRLKAAGWGLIPPSRL